MLMVGSTVGRGETVGLGRVGATVGLVGDREGLNEGRQEGRSEGEHEGMRVGLMEGLTEGE